MNEKDTIRDLGRVKARFDAAGKPLLPSSLRSEELFRRLDNDHLSLPEGELTPEKPARVIAFPTRAAAVAAALLLVAGLAFAARGLLNGGAPAPVQYEVGNPSDPDARNTGEKQSPEEESLLHSAKPKPDHGDNATPQVDPPTGGGEKTTPPPMVGNPSNGSGMPNPPTAGGPVTGGNDDPDQTDALGHFLLSLSWAPGNPPSENTMICFEANGSRYGLEASYRLWDLTASAFSDLSQEEGERVAIAATS